MNRPVFENLLSTYVASLAEAIKSAESTRTRAVYGTHGKIADKILARWRGGDSPAKVKADLETELWLYTRESLSGDEAELVGRAFGDVCRYLGITIRIGS